MYDRGQPGERGRWRLLNQRHRCESSQHIDRHRICVFLSALYVCKTECILRRWTSGDWRLAMATRRHAPCGRYVNRARACSVHTHTRHDAACRRTARRTHTKRTGMSGELRNSKTVPVKGLSSCLLLKTRDTIELCKSLPQFTVVDT